MPEPKIEYACRFTTWVAVPGRPGEMDRGARYDFTGTGESGFEGARRIVESTRAWQPHHDLPVDAVVVSRPVAEWKEVPDA